MDSNGPIGMSISPFFHCARKSPALIQNARHMPAPNRLCVLTSAALAVATPLLAGNTAWHYVDESQRSGLEYVVLYWPSILLSHLPAVVADVVARSALHTVLLYFAGYLLACHLVRTAVAALVRRNAARPSDGR